MQSVAEILVSLLLDPMDDMAHTRADACTCRQTDYGRETPGSMRI